MKSESAVAARTRVNDACRRAAERLRAAGIENAELDARVLLAHALGIDAAQLIAASGRTLASEVEERFNGMIDRRAAHEPVARILSVREFWSRNFSVSADVLVPRPETETIVEAALRAKPNRDAPLRVLDLGVGSGVLLATILLERPNATGVGVDRSVAAIEVARNNFEALGIAARAQIVCGDWGKALDARFDLVVANPPYVAGGEIVTLPPDVRSYDPRDALDGGADGLDAYRSIIAGLPRLLASDGVAVLELGAGQEPAVAGIARGAHMVVNGPAIRDLSGQPRALVVEAGEPKKTLGATREPH